MLRIIWQELIINSLADHAVILPVWRGWGEVGEADGGGEGEEVEGGVGGGGGKGGEEMGNIDAITRR